MSCSSNSFFPTGKSALFICSVAVVFLVLHTIPSSGQAGEEEYYYDYGSLNELAHQNCTGHGENIDGRCFCHSTAGTSGECTSELFSLGGSGFVGEYCHIATSSLGLQKEVVSQHLEADNLMCWTVCWGGASWEHLAVQLERLDDDEEQDHGNNDDTSSSGRWTGRGDPDLYGKLYYNGMNAELSAGLSGNFDFSETSSGDHRVVQQVVSRSDVERGEQPFTGAFLCVHAYGDVAINYNLRWEVADCPVRFSAVSGELLECSAPRDQGGERRCSQGQCMCPAENRAPSEGHAPGTGFEDCSAQVAVLEGKEALDEEALLEPDSWKFYRFEVTEDDNQVVLDLMSISPDFKGQPELYLRHGMPPGAGSYREYDLKTQMIWSNEFHKTDQLILTKGDDRFRLGTWYAGVHAESGEVANFTFSLHKYLCPMDCSGHGVCLPNRSVPGGASETSGPAGLVAPTHICRCEDNFFSPPGKGDCSAESRPLVLGEVRSDRMSTSEEYAFFLLPYVTQEMAARDVELEITLRYRLDQEGMGMYDMWEPFFSPPPRLLLKRGGDDVYPSAEEGGADYQLDMPLENHLYQLMVPASSVNVGHWKAAVYYPSHRRGMDLNVSAVLHAYCPNNCTSAWHGTCNPDGSCTCQHGFSGSDCAFQTNTCLQNTFKQQKVESLGRDVTCMKPCVCQDLHCQYTQDCQICLPPFRLHRIDTNPLVACVLDECSSDELIESEEEHFVCQKKCLTPQDGSAKRLAPECKYGTKMCLEPYALDLDGTCRMLERKDNSNSLSAATSPSSTEKGGRRSSGVATWAVVLVAFSMFAVGAAGGAGGLFGYQWYKNDRAQRAGGIWHDVDAEFSMARF